MNNPVSGYDLTKYVNKATDAAKAGVGRAVGNLRGDAAVLNFLSGNALEKSAGKLIDKVGDKAIINAADALKNKLGGKLDSLTALAGKAKDIGGKLKGLSSKFGGGGSDIGAAATASMSLINAKLADSMFVALPTDPVEVVDGYGIQSNQTLNTVVDKLTGFSKDLLGSMGGIKGIGTDLLKGITSTIRSGGSLNADALKDRVLQSIGGRAGALSKLTDGVKNAIGEATGIPAGVLDRVETTVNGVVRSYNTGDIKSAAGIFDVIGTITRDSEIATFFDVGAEAELLSSIYREAISLGIPEAVDVMNQKAKSSEAAYYALQSNIVVAAREADLTTMSLMVDTLGRDRVMADYPQAVSAILSNYRFPTTNLNPSEYQAEYERLTQALSAIDPDWDRVPGTNPVVFNLQPFNNLSDDARRLFMNAGDERTVAVMLAPEYQPVDGIEQLRSLYPGAVI